MIPTADWSGRLLTQALTELPALTLNFYSFGVMLHKRDGDQVTEYPVDPTQVALALSAKVQFDTGLLSHDTLLVRQVGVKKVVIGYRKPQKTGLFLEDSDTALRVPMPGLVLIRLTADDKNPQYQVYAVKKRPMTLDEPLYHPPLPNVFAHGNVCWGTVQRVTDTALQGASLAEDWAALLGSPFNNHGVASKSKSQPTDIRQMLIVLEKRQARTYPKRDLLPVKRTLAQILENEK